MSYKSLYPAICDNINTIKGFIESVKSWNNSNKSALFSLKKYNQIIFSAYDLQFRMITFFFMPKYGQILTYRIIIFPLIFTGVKFGLLSYGTNIV
jgi:hypothetical protein